MSRGGPARDPDEDHPHDEARSAAQIEGVLALLGPPPRRVLDVGCGAGRVVVPLARAGHHVTGLDADETALDACRAALGKDADRAALVQADFTSPWPLPDASFDAVLCLGNTFMLLADVDEAVDFLARAAAALDERGLFILDDIPHDLWPEVTSGRWQDGVSDDGTMQLLWARDDAVFVLREGEAVREAETNPRPGERRQRLWTSGALRLAARAGGLSAPEWRPGAGLLVLRRAEARGAGANADLA